MIAEEGYIRFLQASVEDLGISLGLTPRDAKFASIASVIGDSNNLKNNEDHEDDEVAKINSATAATTAGFGILQTAMTRWEKSVGSVFHEVFAKEVFAKDLPSLL